MIQNEITLNELLNALKDRTIDAGEYSNMSKFMLLTILSWEQEKEKK